MMIKSLNGNYHTRIISIVTALLVGLLALGALALSYNALRAVAVGNGIAGWQSYIWPLLIDASLVVFSLAVVSNHLRGQRTRWPWFLVGLYTLATLIFNLIHAPGHPTAWAVAVVAPASLFLSFETLMSMLRSEVKRSAVIASFKMLTGAADKVRTELDALTGQLDRLTTKRDNLKTELAELRQEKRQLVDSNRPQGATTSAVTIDRARGIFRQRVEDRLPLPSGAELGRLLGVSKTTGNNVKRELLPEFTNGNGTGKEETNGRK